MQLWHWQIDNSQRQGESWLCPFGGGGLRYRESLRLVFHFTQCGQEDALVVVRRIAGVHL